MNSSGFATSRRGHADVAAGFSISAGWLANELGLTLTALHLSSYGVDFYGGAI